MILVKPPKGWQFRFVNDEEVSLYESKLDAIAGEEGYLDSYWAYPGDAILAKNPAKGQKYVQVINWNGRVYYMNYDDYDENTDTHDNGRMERMAKAAREIETQQIKKSRGLKRSLAAFEKVINN